MFALVKRWFPSFFVPVPPRLGPAQALNGRSLSPCSAAVPAAQSAGIFLIIQAYDAKNKGSSARAAEKAPSPGKGAPVRPRRGDAVWNDQTV